MTPSFADAKLDWGLPSGGYADEEEIIDIVLLVDHIFVLL